MVCCVMYLKKKISVVALSLVILHAVNWFCPFAKLYEG